MLGNRSLFAAVDADHYLNHAAMSPPSQAVVAACTGALRDFAARGVSGWADWSEQRDRLRHKLATLLHAADDEIALLSNTTQGIVDVALSLRWARGDRIVLFEGEFPTNVTPWQRAAERFGLEIVFLPPDGLREGQDLAPLRAMLEQGARLVAVSAVQFQTGFRVPLKAMATLCHTHGAELFVDGIQAVGAVPLDLHDLGVDYLAAGGHKWLMGPEGTGMLYVARHRLAALDPMVAGWLSHEDAATFLFAGAGHLRYDRPLKGSADVFEVGVMNSVGFAGMEAAVDLLLQIGIDRIHDHVQTLLDPLEAGLIARGFRSTRSTHPHERSCILSVLPPDDIDLAELHAALAAHGVAVATPDGFLRLSPHWPNDLGQVEPVLATFDAALAGLRAAANGA